MQSDLVQPEQLHPSAEKPVTQRTVRFRRVGQFAIETTDAVDQLNEISPLLYGKQCRRIVVDLDRPTRTTCHWECVGAGPGLLLPCVREHDCIWRCFVGHFEAVKKLLAHRGLTATIEPDPILPEPDPSAVAVDGRVDHPLLSFVQQHGRGLVQHDPQYVDTDCLVAQVVDAYPNMSIAVLAARRHDAREFAHRLDESLPVSLVLRPDEKRAGRNLVTTYTAVASKPSIIAHRDIVIALDAFEAIQRCGIEAIAYAAGARLYGLLACDRTDARSRKVKLRGVFGFERVEIPRHGHHRLPIDVVWCRFGGQTEQTGGSLLEDLAWRNSARNDCIASIAKAMRSRNHQVLAPNCPDVTGLLPSNRAPSVNILVDALEHAVLLARRLPDWPLVDQFRPSLDSLRAEDQKIYEQATNLPRRPDQQIVTRSAFKTVDLRSVDFLVMADGASKLPAIGIEKWSSWSIANGHSHRLVLVDFRHDEEILQPVYPDFRRELYLKNGWYRPGTNRVDERVKRFLEAQAGPFG